MHTHKSGQGTVFLHNGDYSGDVNIISRSQPETYTRSDGKPAWGIQVPFADLRELVFAYLRDRQADWLEQADDDALEGALLPGLRNRTGD
jgi:hypothetical protein